MQSEKASMVDTCSRMDLGHWTGFGLAGLAAMGRLDLKQASAEDVRDRVESLNRV